MVGQRKTGALLHRMKLTDRIAIRYVFESRILIRFSRRSEELFAQGWARDLSESGLGAFVGEAMGIGESVTLLIELGESGKHQIAAKVARKLGTEYGFQFTALSADQRLAIQSVIRGQPAIPYTPPSGIHLKASGGEGQPEF